MHAVVSKNGRLTRQGLERINFFIDPDSTYLALLSRKR